MESYAPTLELRVGNLSVYAASKLVRIFGCRISEIEPKYYADGENAYAMKKDLSDVAIKVGEDSSHYPIMLCPQSYPNIP